MCQLTRRLGDVPWRDPQTATSGSLTSDRERTMRGVAQRHRALCALPTCRPETGISEEESKADVDLCALVPDARRQKAELFSPHAGHRYGPHPSSHGGFTYPPSCSATSQGSSTTRRLFRPASRLSIVMMSTPSAEYAIWNNSVIVAPGCNSRRKPHAHVAWKI